LQCYRNVLEKDDYAWAKKNVLLWRSREPDKEVGPGKHRIRWIVNKDMNDFHLKMSYAMDYQKLREMIRRNWSNYCDCNSDSDAMSSINQS